MLTVAVDFDGVLNSYLTKWEGPEVLPDPPVPGAIEWLNEVCRHFQVYVFSTRAATSEGCLAIVSWLIDHGAEGPLTITDKKIPAHIYIDDRAYLFTGANFPSVGAIKAFQRWGHEEPKE